MQIVSSGVNLESGMNEEEEESESLREVGECRFELWKSRR